MTSTFESEDEISHYVYPLVLQRNILQQQQILSYTELPRSFQDLFISDICSNFQPHFDETAKLCHKLKVIALTRVHCSSPSMNEVFSFK